MAHPIHSLLTIMAQLRDKETGCPWDIEQNFATIAPYTLEEAYEVADAIAEGDMENLKEELGDLLLQVVFHSQMAKEEGLFTFEDVTQAISEKLIRRHPHVFGDKERGNADSVIRNWDAIKAEEKKDKQKKKGILSDVPRALPALTRAEKLQKKAAKVGFDWATLEPIFDKLQEEVGELKEAIEIGTSPAHITEEMGDLLFVCANLARKLDVQPEEALRGANTKFERRFRFIEEQLLAQGRNPDNSTLEEMDALWDEAKKLEKQ